MPKRTKIEDNNLNEKDTENIYIKLQQKYNKENGF